jgi:hypothetical protein
MATPSSFTELFEFYYRVVKPLYGAIQLTGTLPGEVLFEINAAFDHISRHWKYQESEKEAAEKAYAHLKRSCLDIFKLYTKEARRQFDELRMVDTSIIDNGEFDRKLLAIWRAIKEGGANARKNEGDTRNDAQAIAAFELWFPVYENCIALERDFYSHQGVDWARKRQIQGKWAERGIGFILGILASLVAAVIFCWIQGCFTSTPSVNNNPPSTRPVVG